MANVQFNAKDYGSVAYNFGPDAPEIKGTIPDPSDEMIQQYHKDIRQLMQDSGINDLPSETEMRLHPERMDEYMDRLDKHDQIDTHHQLLEIIAKLCSNEPGVDEMMKLPYRKRIRFVRFAQKELTNPEV